MSTAPLAYHGRCSWCAITDTTLPTMRCLPNCLERESQVNGSCSHCLFLNPAESLVYFFSISNQDILGGYGLLPTVPLNERNICLYPNKTSSRSIVWRCVSSHCSKHRTADPSRSLLNQLDLLFYFPVLCRLLQCRRTERDVYANIFVSSLNLQYAVISLDTEKMFIDSTMLEVLTPATRAQLLSSS